MHPIPIKKLNNELLIDYPLWEIYREQEAKSELKIQPVADSSDDFKKRLESAMIFDIFYARTIFTIKNGRKFQGYCQVSNHTHVYSLQPYNPKVIIGNKHIPFWYGMHLPTPDKVIENFLEFEAKPEEIFPIHFKIIPDIHHITDRGIIYGFTGIDDELKDVILSLPANYEPSEIN